MYMCIGNSTMIQQVYTFMNGSHTKCIMSILRLLEYITHFNKQFYLGNNCLRYTNVINLQTKYKHAL